MYKRQPLHITHGTPSIKFTDSSSSANYSMTLDGVTVNNTNAGTNGSIAFHTHNGEKLRLGATNSYFSNTNVGIGTASPAYKFDVYGTDDITMRIHRPSSGLAETDTCGIGFSHRGDANTSTSDTRAAIVSTYNGSLYLCTEPSGNLNANPVDHAALAITGTNQSVTIGTTTPQASGKLTVNGGIRFNHFSAGHGLNCVSNLSFNNSNTANACGSVYYKMFILNLYHNNGHSQSLFLANGGGGVGFRFTVINSGEATIRNGIVDFNLTTIGSAPNTFRIQISNGGGALTVSRTNGTGSFGVNVMVLAGG